MKTLIQSMQFILPVTLAMSSWAMADTSDILTQFIGDTNYTTNVFDISAKAGLTGAPAVQPWSGSYWPLREGSIANPYDQNQDPTMNFVVGLVLKGPGLAQKNYESRMSKIRAAIDNLDPKTIDTMAPSEKYDLFLGDHDFSLTNSIWQGVLEQNKHIGHIADWEGSCQGWTAAASFSPRPAKAITVMSLDGKYPIPFYPDDLKALGTLLWANSLIQDYTTLQGERCTSSNPDFDSTDGHVNNTTCQGVNPGNFHVSMLELIGARKGHFIIDRSNNTQVWNQPIAGYTLKYFNPITNTEGDIGSSVVMRKDYQNDPFSAYRLANTVSVVGVHMTVMYVSETLPAHNQTDDMSKDKVKNLDLVYDLEMDANSQIIGGQWRDSTDDVSPDAAAAGQADIPKFPGFIWKFKDNTPMAMSIADADLGTADLTSIAPATLIAASKKASAFRYNEYKTDKNGNQVLSRAELQPQPLQKVVTFLVNQSK